MTAKQEQLYDARFEDALIAAAILDYEVFDRVGDIVSGSDFFDSDRGHLWEVMRSLHESGVKVSVPVLLAEFEKANVKSDLANRKNLIQLLSIGHPEVRHADEYALRVKEYAVKRQQLVWLGEAQRKILDRRTKSTEVAEWLDARMQSLGQTLETPCLSFAEVASGLLSDLREPASRSKPLMTGLLCHDEITGGWLGGEMVVLAARPGMGKTVLGLQFCQHNAWLGKSCLFVSLEMRDRELVTRVLCGRSGVDSRVLRSGAYTADTIASLQVAADEIADMPAAVWAPPKATLTQIRAVAKRHAASAGLDFLVVDYIGLIRPADSRAPRHEQIGEISKGLKILAKELDVPLLALCQLNREADTETPKLKNLRDSGSIEQDADVVMFLHRQGDDGPTKLIIPKHRHGVIGSMEIQWNPKRMSYEDPEPAWMAEREQEALEDFGRFSDGVF